MKLIKFIIRNIIKLIDSLIEFINYVTNLNLSKLPKFSKGDNKND